MSRQFPPMQRNYIPPTPDNPYQPTTASTLPLTHNTIRSSTSNNRNSRSSQNYRHQNRHSARRNNEITEDEAVSDHRHYEFYGRERHERLRGDGYSCTDFTTSDSENEEISRIPYCEYDEISEARYERIEPTTPQHREQRDNGMNVGWKVYPVDERRKVENEDAQRFLQEAKIPQNYSRRGHLSRMSGNSRFSGGSEAPGTIVHGCGGKCPTFENVCYYFLQVAFTMGILIGVSLGIAGWVLRKSASRNLQVLLYIGAMLSLVCALLLAIQCNARNNARMRQKAIRNAKRNPIQMDYLTPNGFTQNLNNTVPRGLPVTLVAAEQGPVLQIQQPQPQLNYYNRQQLSQMDSDVLEEPGIPWWRRRDLN